MPPQFPYRNASTFFSGDMSPLKYASTGKCGGIEILMEFLKLHYNSQTEMPPLFSHGGMP